MTMRIMRVCFPRGKYHACLCRNPVGTADVRVCPRRGQPAQGMLSQPARLLGLIHVAPRAATSMDPTRSQNNSAYSGDTPNSTSCRPLPELPLYGQPPRTHRRPRRRAAEAAFRGGGRRWTGLDPSGPVWTRLDRCGAPTAGRPGSVRPGLDRSGSLRRPQRRTARTGLDRCGSVGIGANSPGVPSL